MSTIYPHWPYRLITTRIWLKRTNKLSFWAIASPILNVYFILLHQNGMKSDFTYLINCRRFWLSWKVILMTYFDEMFAIFPSFFCCIVDIAVKINDNQYLMKGIENIDSGGNQSYQSQVNFSFPIVCFRWHGYIYAKPTFPIESTLGKQIKWKQTALNWKNWGIKQPKQKEMAKWTPSLEETEGTLKVWQQ